MDERINDEIRQASKNNRRMGGLFVFLSFIVTVSILYLDGEFNEKAVKFLIYLLLTDFIILSYIFIFRINHLESTLDWLWLLLCYLFSIGVMFSKLSFLRFPIFMIGTVLIAVIFEVHLGLLATYGVAFLNLLIHGQSLDHFITELVLGSFFCFFAKYFQKLTNILLILIFTTSMGLTLSLIQFDFELSKVFLIENLIYNFSYLIVALVVSCLYYMIRVLPSGKQSKRIMEASTENEEMESQDNIKVMDSFLIENNELDGKEMEENQNRLQEIIAEDYPLRLTMSVDAPQIYAHSMSIAELSKKAASYIGADQSLAFAGGLYHEIGRMRGKDYVTFGVDIAVENTFPQAVISIIRQHNPKVEYPQSVEAAIVMLSDNIVSTKQYLKGKQQETISMEKIIDNTFDLRFKSGVLNSSGLDLQSFYQLKKFYLLEFVFSQEK